MSINACDRALICGCDATPFRNFSAEAPDPADFFAMAFFAGSPPLNAPAGFWTIPGSALGTCESIVSPEDAQDCATREAENTVWDTWIEGGVPVRQFGNAEQVCVLPCAAGEDPFVYTLAAGTVIATSQAEADALAASICFYRARLAKVCIPNPVVFSIDALLLDNVSDLAKNAKVITGDVGGFAAAYKNGTIFPERVPTSLDGAFFGVSPNGHLVTGYDHLPDYIDDQHATSRDMVSGSFNDLGSGGNPLARAGQDVTDDGAVLSNQSAGNLLLDVFTGAIIANIGTAFPSGFTFQTNARTLNNNRQVVGNSGNGDGRKLYRWTGGVALNISPPLLLSAINNKAIAINEAGHACGTFRDNVFFQDHSWFYDGFASIRLPDFGGIVNVKALGDSDIVVGEALAAGVMSAFYYTAAAGINLIPFITGMTPGATGIAHDVNDHGWIVGTMDNKGFVYRNGSTETLTDLLPVGSDWDSVDEALFINNLDQVVGRGTYLGVPGTYYIMQLV